MAKVRIMTITAEVRSTINSCLLIVLLTELLPIFTFVAMIPSYRHLMGLIAALRKEPLSVVVKNGLRFLSSKEHLYSVRNKDGISLQITHLYATSESIQIGGWATQADGQIQGVGLVQDQQRSSLTYGLCKTGILHIGKDKTENIGFLGVLPRKSASTVELAITTSSFNEVSFAFELPNSQTAALAEQLLDRARFKAHFPKGEQSPIQVNIIIPFKDKVHLLKTLLNSIETFEPLVQPKFILVDNQSEEQRTQTFIEELKSKYNDLILLQADFDFNYSRLMNMAYEKVTTDHLIILNSDIELIEFNALRQMIQVLDHNDVDMIGPKLLYPQGTIQSVGIVVTEVIPFYSWKHYADDPKHPWVNEARTCAALTGACMVLKKSVLDKGNKWDEALPVTLNDVDYCLSVLEEGQTIVIWPASKMIHHESLTRGKNNSITDIRRTQKEKAYFRKKWKQWLKKGDPYYHHSLSRKYPDYRLKKND